MLRAKIIKAGMPSYWYAKYIGEEIDLDDQTKRDKDGINYYVANTVHNLRIFDMNDARKALKGYLLVAEVDTSLSTKNITSNTEGTFLLSTDY